jgi:L-fuconolactonase
MLIDAHCHVWRLGENDQTWPPPDLKAIHRDFSLADLRAAGGPLGLNGVVLVQSQPSPRDTAWLLALAAEDPLAMGVVGWTDLADADVVARIVALAGNPRLKGLRAMLQDLPGAWILDPGLDHAIEALVATNLAFDVLIKPEHLPSILSLVRRWPDLRLVIDHGAKPRIGEGRLDPWRDDIAALAEHPSVHCKLSGLLTEAGKTPDAETVAPFVEHLLGAFGPDRLIWGSDWPVLTLSGDYAGWRALCAALTPASAHAALFGETARRFYRL